jgi:hypothetical protein
VCGGRLLSGAVGYTKRRKVRECVCSSTPVTTRRALFFCDRRAAGVPPAGEFEEVPTTAHHLWDLPSWSLAVVLTSAAAAVVVLAVDITQAC